jgi:hypothetical protein
MIDYVAKLLSPASPNPGTIETAGANEQWKSLANEQKQDAA